MVSTYWTPHVFAATLLTGLGIKIDGFDNQERDIFGSAWDYQDSNIFGLAWGWQFVLLLTTVRPWCNYINRFESPFVLLLTTGSFVSVQSPSLRTNSSHWLGHQSPSRSRSIIKTGISLAWRGVGDSSRLRFIVDDDGSFVSVQSPAFVAHRMLSHQVS